MKIYKTNRKLTEFTCDQCGRTETKPTSEYNRNIKLGRKNFCSRSCTAQYSNTQIPRVYKKDRYDIKQHAGDRRDKYTAFRYTFRTAKNRFKDFNLTLDDLVQQWNAQGGICPYSHIQLDLPEYCKKVHFSVRASLDRIDSSKGYVPGNIQFVSTMINLMKAELPTEDVIKFRDQLLKNFCPCYQED